MANTIRNNTQVIAIARLRRPITLTAEITSGSVTVKVPHSAGFVPASGGQLTASGSLNMSPSDEVGQIQVVVVGTATYTVHGT